MEKLLRNLIAVAVIGSLIFSPSLSWAKGNKGGGDKGGSSPSGFEKGGKKGWGDSDTPPGWGKGEKKGWDGEEMPPGLFKKKGD